MDRSKSGSKRPPNKLKSVPLGVDFIALGKSGRVDCDKPSSSSSHSSSKLSVEGRKRDAQPSTSIPSKKPKLSTSLPTSLKGTLKVSEKVKEESWESVAIEVDSCDLVTLVLESDEARDDERIEKLLCGSIRLLRSQRTKPDPSLFLSLTFLAKVRPLLFISECVVQGLCSLLKRDVGVNFKTKGNPTVPVLVCNILYNAFKDDRNWPEIFIRVYIEDALGERVWVDHEECKMFIDNIVTAFNTKMPPKSLLQSEMPGLGARADCPSPPTVLGSNLSPQAFSTLSHSDLQLDEDSNDSIEKVSLHIFPRYLNLQDTIETNVRDMIRDQLNKRQPLDNISRNFLRLLITACGLPEIRLLVVQRLEMWLQNPKLMRPSHDLLMVLCFNCNTHSSIDLEVITALIRIRLKTKPLMNHFTLCLKELLAAHPDNLFTVLKYTVYSELSNSRNPNNLAIIAAVFQHSSSDGAVMLAQIFQELLFNKEDYLRHLRVLMREIVKVLRHDFPFEAFCLNLLKEPKESLIQGIDYKDRIFASIADIIALCILLAISPGVREAAVLLSRGDKKDVEVIQKFQYQVATIQRDAVWWFHMVVPKIFRPNMKEFAQCLHKILFMDQAEHYYSKDNWPSETDRNILLRMASEVPVLEDTLLRIMIIGLSKEHPFNAPDALELGDQLIKRAAAVFCDDFTVLKMNKLQIIDVIFNLTAYHHPENIVLPAGYTPPKLAITNLYWKAWIMLLIITAHNPSAFGAVAWDGYPTLRAFMEMCITNHFSFPPPSMASGDKAEDLRTKEQQLSLIEKNQILEFEIHLAAASTKVTITESNSLLLSQLTSMEPGGIARKPPSSVLEQVKTLNSSLKLGHLLCRSRHPDFLLDILQRQGSAQAMPWLVELVESSEGAFNLLPVQCLCEFLLNGNLDTPSNLDGDIDILKDKDRMTLTRKNGEKRQQLVKHIQEIIYNRELDSSAACEILDYFLRRLSSQQAVSRQQAALGLLNVLCNKEDYEDEDEYFCLDDDLKRDRYGAHSWLSALPDIPHFMALHGTIIAALRQACQVENDVDTVAAYIRFLSEYTVDDALQDMSDLVLDLAQLIVERSTITGFLLPSVNEDDDSPRYETLNSLLKLFLKHVQKAREPNKEAFSWSESQDQILVQWESGETATMHILVVHAMVILLTYGPAKDPSNFFDMLKIWFPEDTEYPSAFLVDTSEEALLLPDWLKLRMIRSHVEVLVDAALKNLTPAQLVLFIQSFGIPVQSMSKLLCALDEAVEFDEDAVTLAVMDKVYMAQLVEVQHLRGAIGGYKFAEILGAKDERMEVDETKMKIEFETQAPCGVVDYRGPLKTDKLKSDINQLLMSSQSIYSLSDQIFLWRNIQKQLYIEVNWTKELKTLSGVVSSVHQIIGFKHKLKQKTLFNILMNIIKYFMCKFSDKISSSIAEQINSIPECSPSVTLTENVGLSPIVKRQNLKKLFLKDSSIMCQSESELMRFLKDKIENHLEANLSNVIHYCVKLKKSSLLVNVLVKLLMEFDFSSTPKSVDIGLFVDWLELMEPEMVSTCPELQHKLLFSKQGLEINMSKKSSQSYLLSLLTHHGSWKTLQSSISLLLKKDCSDYNPSSILNFLWSCLHIPKLWKGRDKYEPKHQSPVDILGLSSQESVILLHFILEELSSQGFNLPLVERRLKLLMRCCPTTTHLHAVVFELVMQKGEIKYGNIAEKFLLQLYLKSPNILTQILTGKNNFFISEFHFSGSSAFDVLSHTILTALATTEEGKDCLARMENYELFCRKMASSHPLLLLRQLPMLASFLHGRVHLEFNVFKSGNHLPFFLMVIGIIELLTPHVFESQYSKSFHDILDSYFTLYQYHGNRQDLQLNNLLSRLLTLFHQYVSKCPTKAMEIFQNYSSHLHELLHYHKDCVPLQSLVTGIMLPTAKVSKLRDGETPVSVIHTPPMAQLNPSWTQSQLAPVLSRLRSSETPEDILSVLQDIDNISSKKIEVLEYLLDELKVFVFNSSLPVRSVAHKLILRQLKSKPSSAGLCVPVFLQCLESNNNNVIMSVLEKLADIVTLSQEHAGDLLEKVFKIGLLSNIDVAPHISESISMLNLQTGT